MDTKVYCLDPKEIVNPQLVGFILSTSQVYYHDKDGFHPYMLPHLARNCSTKDLKATLRSRLRRWLRHAPHVDYFMNEDGVCIDSRIKVPCGHCLLCTERKKKSFAAKCIMETQLHDYLPIFATLTYNDAHLPSDGVNYRDIQLFLKRLRINLQRNYGFTGKLTFAVGSEYGSRTHRPHYHLLLWGLPRDRQSGLWHFYNVKELIRDSWQQGFVYLEQCSNSNAAFYVGKYMSKNDKVPHGCNAPVHRTSINLGVDFVMDKAAGVLRASPDYTEVKYCDKFSGKVLRIPLVKYFIDKVFPTYTSVPVEQRNALRDFQLSKDRHRFEVSVNLPLLDTEIDAFKDTTHDFRKLYNAVTVLKGIEGKEFPDFTVNKAKRELYYIHLMDNLGDIDLEHMAYKLTKKQAKDKDKEIF